MPSTSFWTEFRLPRFTPLRRNISVDVAVVGGGNTGVSAAYLLKRCGRSVALIEKARIGGVDTGHTSAHLTYVTDLRVRKLVRRLGRDHARAVFDAGLAAMQQIEANVCREKIDCDFARVPGYLHASLVHDGDERPALRKEAELADELGFPAEYVSSVPLFQGPGVRFPNQARFHPLKYLRGLLKTIPGDGSYVFEQTEAEEIADEPLHVRANGHTIRCKFIVIATDVPLQGKTNLAGATLFQTKIAPYTSYVIGARIPRGAAPDALLWDTTDPYFFFRISPGARHDNAIFGGADHKTGQERDPAGCYAMLERVLRTHLPTAKVDRRWSGQVIEAVDGLPYIGETSERQFVATGFSGNGLTFGTLGAMMACDAAMRRKNPWQDLFRIRRKKLGEPVALRAREQGLPLLPHQGSCRESRRAIGAQREARAGNDSQARGRASGRVSQSTRKADQAESRVHSPGMSGAMERIGSDVGLPVSRVAVSPHGRGACGPGGSTACAGQMSESQSMVDPADESRSGPEPGVIAYASLSARRSWLTLPRLAMAGLVVACASFAFNVTVAARAIWDYRDVQRTVYGRDPARRAVIVIRRGLPAVYPSKRWLTAVLVESALSAALAVVLARGAVASMQPDPSRGIALLDRFARWKLLTFWLGPLVAVGMGRNLSRVRTEFEFLGDLGHFHSVWYTSIGLTAAVLGCLFPIVWLRYRYGVLARESGLR